MQPVLSLMAQVVGCGDDQVVACAWFVGGDDVLYAGLEYAPVHIWV